MDLYRHYISPRVVDFACSNKGFVKWRSRCVEDLSGLVIEIGFGAGRNLALYPSSVSEVIAIEPSNVMRKMASRQIDGVSVPVRWGGLRGEDLDIDDNSVDNAVVTFSLCTIEDPLRALRELRRVVKPGGELRVLEHGLAPDVKTARWQHRLNKFEIRLADGCQLTRDPVALVTESGWIITSTFQKFSAGPKPWSYLTSLRATIS